MQLVFFVVNNLWLYSNCPHSWPVIWCNMTRCKLWVSLPGSDRWGPSALQAGGDGQSVTGLLEGKTHTLSESVSVHWMALRLNVHQLIKEKFSRSPSQRKGSVRSSWLFRRTNTTMRRGQRSPWGQSCRRRSRWSSSCLRWRYDCRMYLLYDGVLFVLFW